MTWNEQHPLWGAWLRFCRAEKHLAEADELIDSFSDACVDRAYTEDEYKTIKLRGGFAPIPPTLPLSISDAVHNMRSALDYIVYELAAKDSCKIQDGTQFIIEDVKSDPINPNRGFDARARQYLKGLNVAHIAAIEWLQPYNGVKWTKALRDISNPDKHRKLTAVTHNGVMPVQIRWHAGGRFRGAEKLTIQGPTYDSFDLQFYGREAIRILGAEPIEPPLMASLREIQTGINGAIESFKPEF